VGGGWLVGLDGVEGLEVVAGVGGNALDRGTLHTATSTTTPNHRHH